MAEMTKLKNKTQGNVSEAEWEVMRKKGLLRTRKEGRRFLYSATVSQSQMMIKVTTEMMNHMCDMHKGQLLIAIMKDVPLSKSDIATLENELKAKEDTAPDEVDCNCLATGDC